MEKLFLTLSLLIICSGCTLSYQTISSQGSPSDLVDDNLSAQGEIKDPLGRFIGAKSPGE